MKDLNKPQQRMAPSPPPNIVNISPEPLAPKTLNPKTKNQGFWADTKILWATTTQALIVARLLRSVDVQVKFSKVF